MVYCVCKREYRVSSGNVLLGASLSAIDVNGALYSDLVVGGEATWFKCRQCLYLILGRVEFPLLLQ